MTKRSRLVGQGVEDFQHDGAAHGVVAGPCGERAHVKDNKAEGFLSACLFTKVGGVVFGGSPITNIRREIIQSQRLKLLVNKSAHWRRGE